MAGAIGRTASIAGRRKKSLEVKKMFDYNKRGICRTIGVRQAPSCETATDS